MPIVKMPDGTPVDMPENPSPELLARLRGVIAKQHNFDIDKKFAEGEAHMLIPDAGTKPAAQAEPSALAGIPGAIASAASAIPAQLAGNLAGAGARVAGAPMDEAAKRAAQVAQGLTYEPSDPAKAALEKASRVIQESKLEGLNPATAIPAAVPGAALKAGGTIRDVAGRAVRAIEASPEVDAVKAGAKAVAGAPGAAAQAVVIPEVRQLAQKAIDWGIDIRPDMLTDNKFMRMMGEALEKVPLAGSRADQRQVAFNRVLMQQIGVDTRTRAVQRLTPDVYDAAMNKSGATIGQISEKTPIHLAPTTEAGGLDQSLSAFVEKAQKFDTDQAARIAGNYVKELRGKAEDGVIPGQAFRKVQSEIKKKMRGTQDGDLRGTLSDLNDVLEDAIERHVSVLHPEDVPRLAEARKQYAIGMQIAPLVAKAPRGNISPAGLMGVATSDGFKKTMMARGKSGDVGDLARIGQAFLKEPESSNTTERALTYGIIGGGAAIEPTTAASIYGAANLYNRAGPAVAKRMLGKRKEPFTLQDLSEMAGGE